MMDMLIEVSDTIGGALFDFLNEHIPKDRIRGALLDVDEFWLTTSKIHWLWFYLGLQYFQLHEFYMMIFGSC